MSYPFPLPLSANFRELGGYPAADGRHVKHGIFYRSGPLSELSKPEERAFLNGLHLKLVLDLRSAGECASAPGQAPDGAEYLRISAMHYSDGAEVDFSPAGIERLEKLLASSHSPDEVFAQFYASMPFQNPAFRVLFQALETGKVPLLFHCSAGKDRTGVAAMLILLALGAERETIVEDYLLTNHHRREAIETLLSKNAERLKQHPEEREMLVSQAGVSRNLADKTLDAILHQYNSYEAYFLSEFGLTAERLAALRDQYLEA